MLHNVENVVVVPSAKDPRPVGIVRANDILQLRRWLLVEETGERSNGTQDTLAESPSGGAE